MKAFSPNCSFILAMSLTVSQSSSSISLYFPSVYKSNCSSTSAITFLVMNTPAARYSRAQIITININAPSLLQIQ
ncbi:hypothetical protein BC01_144 [Bacillus phage BC01]|nr:hypothetical protein BC01_144 [Bacillus phage BC01]